MGGAALMCPALLEFDMDGLLGILAVAGGFGLAYGLTAIGLHIVLSAMPSKTPKVATRES